MTCNKDTLQVKKITLAILTNTEIHKNRQSTGNIKLEWDKQNL